MSDDNIIEFPKNLVKKEELDHELDVARMLMMELIEKLQEYHYNPTVNSPLFDDFTIVYNMMYASLCREAGEPHPWHDMMDEINKELLS